MTAAPLSSLVDWNRLKSLRLAARFLSDGVYAGNHRSLRRGAGVEFGGHRDYVPGDDLRFLDHRALMRHGRLYIREFETDTDRALHLLLDASSSMFYQGADAPVSKFFYSAALAAALARLAIGAGDPVALAYIGGNARSLPPLGGREAFERVVGSLEDAAADERQSEALGPADVDRALASVARQARRGSIVVLFSDLVDLPESCLPRFGALGVGRRTLIATQVLDPVEAHFPFDGAVRLQAVEGVHEVETDAAEAKRGYLAALAKLRDEWQRALLAHGGRLVTSTTSDDPLDVLRQVTQSARGGFR